MGVFHRSWTTKKGVHKKAWYVKFQIDGETVYERAKDPDTGKSARTQAEAKSCEAKIRTLFEAKKYGVRVAPRFMDAMKTFLEWSKLNKASYKSDESKAIHLEAGFGRYRLDGIHSLHVEKYKKERLGSKSKRGRTPKPASINRELEMLGRIFSYAIRECGVKVEPPVIKRLKVDNVRLRFLSVEEERKLREALSLLSPHLLDITIVTLATGMRKGEIFTLHVNQVDCMHNVIHLLKTKSGKPRSIPFDPHGEAGKILQRRCWSGESQYLFPNPDTGLPYTDIRKSFGPAVKKAGLTDVVFHTLRHTFGTRLASAGVDVVTIRDLMGHANLETTMRYLHAVGRGKHEAIKALEQFSVGKIVA